MNKFLDTLRVMKLIICLLIISFQASAIAFSQSISLTEKNASIETVIKKIEKQSGYSFFYKVDLIRNNPSKLNLSLKNVTIDQALQQTLINQPLIFVIVNRTVIIKERPAIDGKDDDREEKKTIRGKVTDGKNPIPRVSVRVDGTNMATMTDANGNFMLNLSPGTYRLVFSCIGYESKLVIRPVTEGEDSEINVILNGTIAQLQEAIVVGYTTKKPSEITGSLQTFTARDLEGVTSNNLISMLKGKVAGMYITEPSGDPNSKSTFVVRGQGTLPISFNNRVTNNLNPLIVVDGIIYADAMYPSDVVSTTDIESVTLLKDAASTAIYGSRASQGVLVITTKKGKTGVMKLDINSVFGVSKRYMGKLKFMNSQELYDYQRQMLLNSFPVNDEGLTQDAYLTKYLPDASIVKNYTNWNDVLYRDALTKAVDVGLSGGSETTRYYFGANRYDEQGALKGNALQRTSVRLNLDHDITSRLNLSASLDAIFDKGNTSPLRGNGMTILPWFTLYNDDGTPKKVIGVDLSSNIPTSNPIYDLPYNSNITRTQQLNGIFSVKYKLTDWLNLSSNNSYRTSFINNDSYQDRLSLAGEYYKGSLNQQKTNSNSFMTSNLINARKEFGVHTVGGLAGFEYNRSSNEFNGLGVANLPTGIKVPSAASEPWNIYNGKSFTGERFDRGSYSLFTEGNYNYKEKYFANASYRMDYSTNFGIENRAGHFYSVSGAWLVTNEEFLKGNHYLTNLKFRASYGTSGKVAGEDFLTESFYNFSYQYGGDPAAVINQLGNRSITWEKAFIRNFGVDLELFHRINITTDIYQKRNTNLLQRVGVSALLGVGSQYQNIGEMLNKGIELTLSSQNLIGNFKWRTDFNLTYSTNKVTKLYNGEVSYGNAGIIKEGDDINSVHVFKWLGVDSQTGLPQFERVEFDAATNTYNRKTVNTYDDIYAGLPSGQIMNQFQLVGNSTPKYFGGLQNTFSYKGFELSVLLNFASNYLVFNNSHNTYFSSEGRNILQNNQIKPGNGQLIWQKPGDKATEPMPLKDRTDGADEITSRQWEDASHIRIRNARLSYSLPTQLIRHAKLTKANVFVSGDNLFVFTKKTFYGTDPEGGTVGSDYNYGVGAGYGASRKFLLGVQLSF